MALERKRRARLAWKIVGIIFALIIAAFVVIFAVGMIGYEVNMGKVEKTEYLGSDYAPEMVDGTWTFSVPEGEDFRVLQITDVHLGGGAFSIGKDASALEAVETLIRRTQPDFVVFTGDMVYPVPPQSGSFNNIRETALLTTLMEKLGVYYGICLGNHDTEPYSFYNRDQLYEFYAEQKYCVVDRAEGVDDINYAVNIRDPETGRIRHTLYLMDTHDYVGDQLINIMSNYDGLHVNQIEWYRAEVARMNGINAALGFDGIVPSSLYIHIPLGEYETAINEYRANCFRDTENVKHIFGEVGENPCPSDLEDDMFETILELNSTKWVFCGHDHVNNVSLEYKGVRLTYGMSIDYLAYIGIAKEEIQRGATIIDVMRDGTLSIAPTRLNEDLFKE